MTLTEYLNQKEPALNPKVILQPGEYRQGSYYGTPGHRRADVHIPSVGYAYVAREGMRQLHTSDQDGNPKHPSVFYLPEN